MTLPTVMLAGWGQDGTVLSPLRQAISRLDAQLLDVHGLAGNCRGYSEGLISTLEGHSAVDLIAWSMGGMVALEAALARPDLFRSLTLLGATACFCSTDDYDCGVPEAEARGFLLALRNSPAELLPGFFKQCFLPDKVSAETIRRLTDEALAFGSESLIRGMNYLIAFDIRARLGEIRCPVLVVHGTSDAVIPFSAGEYLSTNLPDSRLVAIPGCHAAPCRPDTMLIQKIRDFLDAK